MLIFKRICSREHMSIIHMNSSEFLQIARLFKFTFEIRPLFCLLEIYWILKIIETEHI